MCSRKGKVALGIKRGVFYKLESIELDSLYNGIMIDTEEGKWRTFILGFCIGKLGVLDVNVL